MSKVMHVEDNEFEKTVLQSSLPVVVDFWAPWCGPCRIVAPLLDRIAEEYAGRLTVAKVNTDESPQWATKYRVTGIPTMLFISAGQVVNQQVGAVSYSALKQMVDQFLAQATNSQSAAN